MRWFCILILFSAVLVDAQYYSSRGSRAKRRCYQCNMPFQCESGSCYGDVCVKSLASGRYVSKGCENNTDIKSSHASVWDPKKETSYCKTEIVFGVESVICYCSDEDFCNHSASPTFTALSLICILLLRIF